MALFLVLFFLGDEVLKLDETTLYAQAMQAFAQGEGKALQLERESYGLAARSVGGRFDSLSFGYEPETRLKASEPSERTLSVSLDMPLAPTAARRRDALLAEGLALDQQRDLGCQSYLLSVYDAFATAMRMHALRTHTWSWLAQAQAQDTALQPLREAELVSKLEGIEQLGFAGRLSDELRQTELELAQAEATLSRLLGKTVATELVERPSPLDRANPYEALLARAPVFAEERALQAAATAAERAADLALAETAPRLGFQLLQRSQGENSWLGAGLQLTWSTRPRRGPEFQQQRALADAHAWRAQVQGKALNQELEQRRTAFTQNQERARHFHRDVLERQRQRVQILQQALEQGLVTRRIWLDAQQDLHDAEHLYLDLTYDLWEAAALADLLTRLSELTP